MKKIMLPLLLSLTISLPSLAENNTAIEAFEAEQYQVAKNLFETQKDGKSYLPYWYLSRIALIQGELDDAEELIDQAISLSPKMAKIHLLYAQVMGSQAQDANFFSAAGYAKKSLIGFETAVELSPDNIEYRRSLIGFYLGAPGIVGGDNDKALKQAKAIVEIDRWEGINALLWVYTELEEEEELEELFTKTFKEYPGEPELFYMRGFYYQQQEKYTKALVDFRQASLATITSDDQRNAKYKSIYQIGRTSVLSKGNYDEGEKALLQYLEEAVISDSMVSKDWAKYRLANILESKGEETRAMELYAKIVQETKTERLKKLAKKKM